MSGCRCSTCPYGRVAAAVELERDRIAEAAADVPWESTQLTAIDNRLAVLDWMLDLLEAER